MHRFLRVSIGLLAVFFLGLSPVMAQDGGALPTGTEITADSLEYVQGEKTLIGSGNVLVTQGEDSLAADYMTVNNETQDVYARGNVVFRRGDKIWQGQELKYNLKTKVGDFGSFNAFVYPWRISAEDSERVSTNEFHLKNVRLTTCDGENPEFELIAREATLKDGNRLKMKGVVVYFGIVPVMYLPTLSRKLDVHETYWDFIPGYSSKHGGYLLSAYNYRIADDLRGRTRLDYRSKRGFGGGQDFIWADDADTLDGELNLYYADDKEPFEDEEDEAETGDLVDSERYRMRLSHFQTFTDRDYMIANLNYLSDPDVLEDFFDSEFREGVQPENRVSLTHRGDQYTAGLLVNKRLNDFYENVDRVPEASLDVQRQRIGETPFYYESENRASQLERVYPDGSESKDYDAFRVDSSHKVFYPTRNFGFLNLIPRTGYRGTYYSDTLSFDTVTNSIVQTDTNGQSFVTNKVETLVNEEGADLRNLYELGLESSFKAFKTWDDIIVLGDGDGLRHISEPFMNYTYNPEPNIRPFELPQFDSVDTLDKRHDVQIGIRNKYQTRRGGNVQDLMDATVYSYYRIEKEDEQEDFTDIFFDVELRLVDWLPLDFDGQYDPYESEFSVFNSQVSYIANDLSSVSAEYRYRRDSTDQVAGEIVLFPNRRWSFSAYGRYDLEGSELEEQSYFIQRQSSCVGYGIGYKNVDEDDQVWFQLWLTAFPGTSIDLGN